MPASLASLQEVLSWDLDLQRQLLQRQQQQQQQVPTHSHRAPTNVVVPRQGVVEIGSTFAPTRAQPEILAAGTGAGLNSAVAVDADMPDLAPSSASDVAGVVDDDNDDDEGEDDEQGGGRDAVSDEHKQTALALRRATQSSFIGAAALLDMVFSASGRRG